METEQRAWRSWTAVSVLAVLCGLLAFLQNRWLYELAVAEKNRLHQELQTKLDQLSRDFNAEITKTCAGLLPPASQVEQIGRENAYSVQYRQWKESHDRVFRRIGLVVPRDGSLLLFDLDLDTAKFTPRDWPPAWDGMRNTLLAKWNGSAFGSISPDDTMLIDLPRFESSPGREQDWLILELDQDFVRGMLLPELLHRHLGASGKLNYDAAVLANANTTHVIFQTSAGPDSKILQAPDASVGLFDVNYPALMFPPDAPRRRPPPRAPIPPNGPGRWRLLVRHQAGSLEAVVSRARWQNLIISVGLLGLILATVVTLVRLSRQSQQLAAQQMNFVAGVSHELRTPVAVIRTAAFNLRGRLSTRPDQVERYGTLIERETEKLGNLIEQVLTFSSARAGQVIRKREPIAIERLIEESLRSTRQASNVTLETAVDPDLPRIMGDELAMRHVIQNLLDNALKYGVEGNEWIGVFASVVQDEDGPVVEIRVADRGPGIPLDEQKHIFDAFFRGRRAVQDHLHGTGLGLNLAKKIVEAHGGTIHVRSEPMSGAEFVIRIPAASGELQDEFAHSTR